MMLASSPSTIATRWAILTGEYPPHFGGVSDYTRLIAAGLVAAGDTVTVYAPAHAGPGPVDPGVTVHRLPDHFGPHGLLHLDAQLRMNPRPHRILIQYVPHAFGWKAMNLAFTTWVAHRARGIAPVWVMFHEVMFGGGRKGSIRHALLTKVTRQMARQLARTAERVFVSIPAWSQILQRIAYSARPGEWLPVPSNFPAIAEPSRIAAVRSTLPGGGSVIGHFGRFGGMNASLLLSLFVMLLRRSENRYGLFIGRGSQQFRDGFAAAHPDLASRVTATGELPADEASSYIAACDLLVQPYPDGISSRRGSAMAGLALGVPTVTNSGFLSEPIWGTDSAGVSVVGSAEPGALAAAAEDLLALSSHERAQRGQAAACWYRSQFAPELTIARLRTPLSSVAPQTDRP